MRYLLPVVMTYIIDGIAKRGKKVYDTLDMDA